MAPQLPWTGFPRKLTRLSVSAAWLIGYAFGCDYEHMRHQYEWQQNGFNGLRVVLSKHTKTYRVDPADREPVHRPVSNWRRVATFALGIGLGVLVAPGLLPTLSDSKLSWTSVGDLAIFLLLFIAVDRLIVCCGLLIMYGRLERESKVLDRHFEELTGKNVD